MKPFLKWAGNKFQIVQRIIEVLPAGNRLIEPFVGSGALFLNTDFPRYLLADANPDLINLYGHLQTDGPEFIEYCRTFFVPENNDSDRYYDFRTEFHATEDSRLKSALFLYMNKHCYNGLCRYNASGGFNVPFGRYKRPYFPEVEMNFFAEKAQTAQFVQADFVETMSQAVPGDVVYCDPPYVPLSATANFTSYSAGSFGADEQRELARQAEKLAARGITVVISNHDTEFVRAEYAQATIYDFDVQRYISRNGNNRGKAAEVLAVFA